MTTVGITHPREPVAGKWWWVFLVTGILWILIGLFVLNAHYDSAVVIGYMVSFWLIFAGVAEFIATGLAPGWSRGGASAQVSAWRRRWGSGLHPFVGCRPR